MFSTFPRHYFFTQCIKVQEFYVLASLYSKYSLSMASEALGLSFRASGCSLTSGYISAKQESPPIVSHASAGNTLNTDTLLNNFLSNQSIIPTQYIDRGSKNDLRESRAVVKCGRGVNVIGGGSCFERGATGSQ